MDALGTIHMAVWRRRPTLGYHAHLTPVLFIQPGMASAAAAAAVLPYNNVHRSIEISLALMLVLPFGHNARMQLCHN